MSILYKLLWGILILGLAYTLFGIVNFKWMYHAINNPKAEFQVLHNPNGDINFVEFLNYECGYCKDLKPVIQDLPEVRKDVRIVVRPIAFDSIQEDGTPIIDRITRYAYAAGLQGKFKEFHAAFLDYPNPNIPDSFIEELAMLYGLNYEQLIAESEGTAVQKIIDENWKRFEQLGLQSVPSFMINNQIHVVTDETMPDLKELLTLIPTH